MLTLNAFRRVTTGKRILEEIDGLRFLAIFYVILAHLHHFIYEKTPFFKTKISQSKVLEVVSGIAQDGQHGVAVFFVISGFILALPFAGHYLQGGQKASLKKFYLRRVTRLEPPYIIALLLLTAAILIKNLHSPQELLPHLLASLTYTHNIIFNSIEVEVQFYLLAPLLAFIFKIDKFYYRALIIFTAIAAFIFFQGTSLVQNSFALSMSLVGWFQYFLVGFLLADIYVSQKFKIRTSRFVEIAVGFILLLGLSFFPHEGSVIRRFVYPLLCFGFFLAVLYTPFWKRFFSIKFISIVGGMCYSIYLLHYATISFVGNYLIKYKVTDSLLINYAAYFLILSVMILFVSSTYFILVEKPCMKADWPSRLLKRLNLGSVMGQTVIKQSK